MFAGIIEQSRDETHKDRTDPALQKRPIPFIERGRILSIVQEARQRKRDSNYSRWNKQRGRNIGHKTGAFQADFDNQSTPNAFISWKINPKITTIFFPQ